VREKFNKLLPFALVLVFALSRIPGALPQNFSAAYALAFCGGLYFSRRLAWWLPLGTLLVTDVLLNVFYYHVAPFNGYLLLTLAGFALIVALGRRFKPQMNFFKLLGGGLLGALVFYLVSNTASWLYDPGYAKTLAGWWQALTTGLPGYPPTWEFFRSTLLSGGLFTGLFVGAMKLTGESPAEKEAGRREAETDGEAEPEEAKA
jgi:hypothetical protein